MTLHEAIKGLDFNRLLNMREELTLDWSNKTMQEAKVLTNQYEEVLTNILRAAIDEGVIGEDDYNGMKTWNVLQTFRFNFDIEAPSYEKAMEKLEKINNTSDCPKMNIRINGVSVEVEGDFADEELSESRWR